MEELIDFAVCLAINFVIYSLHSVQKYFFSLGEK